MCCDLLPLSGQVNLASSFYSCRTVTVWSLNLINLFSPGKPVFHSAFTVYFYSGYRPLVFDNNEEETEIIEV